MRRYTWTNVTCLIFLVAAICLFGNSLIATGTDDPTLQRSTVLSSFMGYSPEKASRQEFDGPVDPTNSGLGSLNSSNSALIEYRGSTAWTHFRDMAISNNLVLGAMSHGLAIYDVSDPQAPYLRSQVDIPLTFKLDCHGTNVVVASYDSCVYLINISNPDSPNMVSYWKPSPGNGVVLDVCMNDQYVYVLTQHVLEVYGIDDPSNPELVGSHMFISVEYHESLLVDNGLAFVVNSDNTVQILDMSNPSSPAEVASIVTHGTPRDMFATSGLLYVADGDAGLTIYDVTDPEHPLELSNYAFASTNKVVVSDSYAYMSTSSGFYILSVDEPTNPSVLGQFDGHGSIVVSADFAFVGGVGLTVVDISSKSSIYIMARFDAFETIQDIAVSEPYIYGAISNGLTIWEYDGGSDADFVTSFEVPGGNHSLGDIAVTENFAFVDDRSYYSPRTYIVDISDASSCFVVDSIIYATGNFPFTLVADDSLLIVATSYGKASLYGISEAGHPALLSRLGTDSTLPSGIVVSDTIAYVGTYPHGLQVYNIKQPSAPSLLTEVYDDAIAVDFLCLSGGYIVGADYLNGRITICRVSPPQPPQFVAGLDLGGLSVTDLAVDGSLAYVGVGTDGLKVIDLADPEHPQLIFEMNGTFRAIELKGSSLFASWGAIYNISSFEGAKEVASTSNPICDQPMLIDGDRAFFLGQAANYTQNLCSLYVADISNHSKPTIVGRGDFSIYRSFNSGHALSIDRSTGYLYIASDSGIFIIDVSDDSSPNLISVYGGIARSNALHVHNGTAAVCAEGVGQDQLIILDVTNSTEVTELASLPLPGATFPSGLDIVREDSILFVTNIADDDNYWGQLLVIDIGTPFDPTILGSWSTETAGTWSTGLGIFGDNLVMGTPIGVWILDITNVGVPSIRATIAGLISTLSLDDSLLAIATKDWHLYAVDLLPTGEPTIIATFYPVPILPKVLEVSSSHIYVADGDGLAIYEVVADNPTDVDNEVKPGLPTAPSLGQNYPNPFNPETRIEFRLPQRSNVRIEIFNVLGQRVRTLVDKEMAAGFHLIIWDGRLAGGGEAPTGVYFYRLRTADFTQTRKMLLLK